MSRYWCWEVKCNLNLFVRIKRWSFNSMISIWFCLNDYGKLRYQIAKIKLNFNLTQLVCFKSRWEMKSLGVINSCWWLGPLFSPLMTPRSLIFWIYQHKTSKSCLKFNIRFVLLLFRILNNSFSWLWKALLCVLSLRIWLVWRRLRHECIMWLRSFIRVIKFLRAK